MNVEDQLTEMNAALAELVDSASTEQVAKVLGEILTVLKTREAAVVVNVSPTPITNVVDVHVPSPTPSDYECEFTYDRDGRITHSRITRVT